MQLTLFRLSTWLTNLINLSPYHYEFMLTMLCVLRVMTT